MKKFIPMMMILLLVAAAATDAGARARKKTSKVRVSSCCKNAGGVCSVQCCDGSFAASACAAQAKSDLDVIEPAYKSGAQPVSIILNGYRFDLRGLLINGHTYVPLRGIFERLGAEVGYIYNTGEILIKYGSRTLVLRVGSNAAKTYGNVYYMDSGPVIVNGVTYVPLRFVTDFLGVHVDWNYYDNTVRITSGKYYREPYYFVW